MVRLDLVKKKKVCGKLVQKLVEVGHRIVSLLLYTYRTLGELLNFN